MSIYNKKDFYNVLILGDVCDEYGIIAVEKYLKSIINKFSIDLVIINGENTGVDGVGCTDEATNRLFKAGMDICTLGNHAFKCHSIFNVIDDYRIARPANLININCGNRYVKIEKNGIKILVINLLGIENMFLHVNNPITTIQELVTEHGSDCDFILVDYHGESYAEKRVAATIMDGKISALVGTHTHVPTADGILLKNNTYYQTDLGMCGCYSRIHGKPNLRMLSKYYYWNSTIFDDAPSSNDFAIAGVMLTMKKGILTPMSFKPIIFGKNIGNTIDL